MIVTSSLLLVAASLQNTNDPCLLVVTPSYSSLSLYQGWLEQAMEYSGSDRMSPWVLGYKRH